MTEELDSQQTLRAWKTQNSNVWITKSYVNKIIIKRKKIETKFTIVVVSIIGDEDDSIKRDKKC